MKMMISKNTKKIVLFLLKRINSYGYNINQLSKELHISVGSSFKILKELEKSNILKKIKINNALNYNLNFENSEAIKLCELLLLSEKRNITAQAKIYAESILEFEQADMIILFGSILKNKNFNDVDVLFLTNQVKKTMDFCLNLSKIRTKPVVPLIMKKQDLIEGLKNKKESLVQIIKNSIVLKGESIFVEVIKNVKT